jgi:hypothetical protein
MADDTYISTLEKDFPHIAQRAVTFWNTDEFFAFITGLATTDRPDRSGFPDAAAEELLLLEQVHDVLHPRKLPSWTHV